MTQDNTSTQSNIDDILDMTLDDLADMPSITPFPNGAHKVTMEFMPVDPKKPSNVQLKLTYVEAMELSDPTSVAPAVGDTNTIFFGLKKKDGTANEFAQGALKLVIIALKDTFPGNTTREIMASAKGAEVMVVTKVRYGKGEYEGKDNIDIVNLAVL